QQPLCHRWVPLAVRVWKRAVNVAYGLTSPLPLQVLYCCPPEVGATVERLLEEETIDLIHVQLARMAPSVSEIQQVPKVIDFVDALSLNMFRRSQQELCLTRWLFAEEGRRMQRFEHELISHFDAQIVCSLADKRAIGEYGTLHVISNGVSLEEFPYTETRREEKVVMFSGRLGYFPNSEAAVFFATNVFPLIRRVEPDARFLIVGADPPRAVRRLVRLPG